MSRNGGRIVNRCPLHWRRVAKCVTPWLRRWSCQKQGKSPVTTPCTFVASTLSSTPSQDLPLKNSTASLFPEVTSPSRRIARTPSEGTDSPCRLNGIERQRYPTPYRYYLVDAGGGVWDGERFSDVDTLGKCLTCCLFGDYSEAWIAHSVLTVGKVPWSVRLVPEYLIDYVCKPSGPGYSSGHANPLGSQI